MNATMTAEGKPKRTPTPMNSASTNVFAVVLDKVRAAINAAEAKNTAIAGAIGPLEESTGHFDILAKVGTMRRK